jgi:Peptidase family M23
VLAAGSGTVIFAGVQSGFGNTVVIDNGNGVTTLYGHLSSIGVNQGQSVGDGNQIALSGATGTVSGPNLHFGVFQNGVAIDPETQLAPDVSSVDWLGTDLTTAGSDLSSVFDGGSAPDPVMVGAAALALGLLAYAFVK